MAKPETIQSPKAHKRFERQFSDFTIAMIAQMQKIYRNQALGELHASTVKKFADATPDDRVTPRLLGITDQQIGNFAAVFLRKSKQVERKLVKRFDDERIEEFTQGLLKKVNRQNAQKLYKDLEGKTGIDPRRAMRQEGLTFRMNALMLETAQWVKKLRDDTLESFAANSLRAMARGLPLTEVIDQFETEAEKKKSDAKFVARQQVSTFNSLATKMRYKKAGIERAVWETASDERVRECHRVRDGKEFDLNEGLYSSCDGKTLLPGTDYNCRCTYRAIIPEFDESGEDG